MGCGGSKKEAKKAPAPAPAPAAKAEAKPAEPAPAPAAAPAEATGCEIYGMMVSGNVAPCVLLATDAKCGKFVFKNALAGEMKQPEILECNAWGQMPTMKDGAVGMGESSAISRYIAMKYKEDAYGGKDPAARAVIDFALDYASTNFGDKGYKALWYPVAGFAPPPDDMAAAQVEATESLEKFEKRFLVDKKLVGGDVLSIADYKFGMLMYNINHKTIQDKTGFVLSDRLKQYVADWEAALSPESKAMLTDGPWSPGGFLDSKGETDV